jgi:hypothetical protein
LLSKKISVIFPFVLHRYETWSLTFRKEQRLRETSGPKREEVDSRLKKAA